jgi:hypothetical protein
LYVLSFSVPPNISGGHGIYPNPANNNAWFYKEHIANTNYKLQIISNEGKLVDELSSQTDHLQIDLSAYSAGLYFYKYVNETTNTVDIGKFVRVK